VRVIQEIVASTAKYVCVLHCDLRVPPIQRLLTGIANHCACPGSTSRSPTSTWWMNEGNERFSPTPSAT
jgi:hypothetical protein